MGEERDQEWTPAFPGQRPPFEPGNKVALGNRGPMTHGAYSSVLASSPLVLQLCEELRAKAPWLTPADDLMLEVFATGVLQFAAVSRIRLPAVADAGDLDAWSVEVTATLSRDQRGSFRDVMKAGDALGLTPAGRAAMEECAQTVMLVADVQAIVTAVFTEAGRFVPAERREEFLDAFQTAKDQLALPPGDAS